MHESVTRERGIVLEQARNQLVVTSNNLVRSTVLNLNSQEQHIIAFLISKIRPDDTVFEDIAFSVGDFCEVSGIDPDPRLNTYQYVLDTLQGLAEKLIVFVADGLPPNASRSLRRRKTRTINWFHHIEADGSRDSFNVRFHDELAPYMLQLRKHFTAYQLRNVLVMRSKYSQHLYKYLRSVAWSGSAHAADLEFLKEFLGAENYIRFPDFKRFVLDPAIGEINMFSDINADYTPLKDGRKYTLIAFDITRKDTDGQLGAIIAQDKRFATPRRQW